MKTTIERIFDTLSKDKVELKSEKVELALIDDLNKSLDGLKSFDKVIAREGQKALSAIQIYKQKVENLKKLIKMLLALLMMQKVKFQKLKK